MASSLASSRADGGFDNGDDDRGDESGKLAPDVARIELALGKNADDDNSPISAVLAVANAGDMDGTGEDDTNDDDVNDAEGANFGASNSAGACTCA